MLFSHRVFDYAANPQTDSGSGTGSYTTVGFSNTALLPTGSQVGDLCVHAVTRNVTSGVTPTGFSTVISNNIGAVGHAGWYARVLTSTDITRGFVISATTNVVRKWTLTFRPPQTITGFTVESAVGEIGQAQILSSLTQTNPITVPTVVIANAAALGGTFSTPIAITNGGTVTAYTAGTENNLSVELVSSTGSTAARTTNSPRNSYSEWYYEVLFAIRGT